MRVLRSCILIAALTTATTIVPLPAVMAADAPGKAPATQPAGDAEKLTERQQSILLQLANAEANVKAINKALVRTGYKVGLAYEQVDNSEKGNELMDRKGGGPVPWDQFYGKTAKDFYYHSSASVYINKGRGATVAEAQYNGPALTKISRPKQFDFIYRANDQQAARANEQISTLLHDQAALLARRQKHEGDQSYLWAEFAWEQVKDREIAFRPLYRFKITPAGARAELLRGPVLFLRTADRAIGDALEIVEADQGGAFADVRQRTKEAYAALQVMAANAAVGAEVKEEDRKDADKLKAMCKQVYEACVVADDNHRRAMDSDRAKEDASKLEYRRELQSSLATVAAVTAALDEQIMTAVTAWGMKPEVGAENPDKIPAWSARAVRPSSVIPDPATPAIPALPAPPAAVPPAQVAAGWVDLFNGRDTSGWIIKTKDRGTWTVQDGTLVSGGGTSALVTARNDFANFRIRVEAMVNDGGNSGVFIRCQDGDGVAFSRYEAQMESGSKDPNKTGSIYLFDTGRKNPASVPVSVKESLTPPNRWFTMEITADGAHIVVTVDGRKTADYQDSRFPRGAIGLQQHDGSTVVKVRKVQVMELAR